MEYLGVFASKDEIKQMKNAASLPYIKVGNNYWTGSPQEVCHRIALKHGFPEIYGYYGCDLRTGEFIMGGR